MSLKGKIEAIIYAADEPVTVSQIVELVRDCAAQEIAAQRASEQPEPGPAETAAPAAEAAGTFATDAPPPVQRVQDGAGEPAPEALSSMPAGPVSADAADTPSAAAPLPITSAEIKTAVLQALHELVAEYNEAGHGIEVRQIAGGYRMATKPEHHDLVRAFAKSLKPPIRLSLQALETLAVIAYKQPITAPEIGEIRGVDSGGVLGTLLDRKLITTAGRKNVIGRPILYKTTKEFLLRFGLKDLNELPSMEEFEKLAQESLGADLFVAAEGGASSPAQAPAEPGEMAATKETESTSPAEPAAVENVGEVVEN